MYRFGKEWLQHSEKVSAVQDVFHRVANRYDLMNDVMSAGLHRIWKRLFVGRVAAHQPHKILDMAAGTGDITRLLHQKLPNSQIIVSDINLDMLEKGRDRLLDEGIFQRLEFVQASAEALPFASESFDVYTISFGLRNVAEGPKALAEAYRVLQSGGRFWCLEFSPMPSSCLVSSIYEGYTQYLIPLMGAWIAQDRAAYQYLVDSIATFYKPTEIEAFLQQAGFAHVFQKPLCGGAVYIHEAVK